MRADAHHYPTPSQLPYYYPNDPLIRVKMPVFDEAFWDMIGYRVPPSQDDLDYIKNRQDLYFRNGQYLDPARTR